METKASDLIRKGQADAAVRLIQGYIDENCSRISRDYERLNEMLPASLNAAGIKYIFGDYLRNWSSKKRVPLPQQ